MTDTTEARENYELAFKALHWDGPMFKLVRERCLAGDQPGWETWLEGRKFDAAVAGVVEGKAHILAKLDASPAPAPISMPTLPDNATVALTNAPPAPVESGDVWDNRLQILYEAVVGHEVVEINGGESLYCNWCKRDVGSDGTLHDERCVLHPWAHDVAPALTKPMESAVAAREGVLRALTAVAKKYAELAATGEDEPFYAGAISAVADAEEAVRALSLRPEGEEGL